jgi:putative transposase
LPTIEDNIIIGFIDEASPQTTSNTQKLWSFHKPEITKNTDKYKANAFGFYPLNGTPVIKFKEESKTWDFCDFLRDIRIANQKFTIIGIADNSRPHKTPDTLEFAEECDIKLIFLPPYSPDLNPIEFIWKSIKRIISHSFIKNAEHLKEIIESAFLEYAVKLSYAKAWIENFISPEDRYKVFGS